MATVALSGIITPTNVVTATSTTTLTNKTLTAPTIASANLTTALTLAGAAGTNGQVLTSAGSGLPSWTTISASQWTTSASDIYYSTGNVGVGVTNFPAIINAKNATNNSYAYSIRQPDQSSSTSTAGWYWGADNNGDTYFTYNTGAAYADRLRINNNGAIVLRGGSATASGVGITFPATQSTSTDANTLDDYEEGTFTPSVTGSITNPIVSYNWRFGYYTKIGNQVTVWLGFNVASISSAGSGDLGVNLPFTSANRSDNRIPGSITGGLSYTAGSVLIPMNYENNASLIFAQFNSTASRSVLSVSSLNGSSESVQICLTYAV
jgi:hypothetical protein